MDRFLSNTINRVDKKGRVSIPARFRPVLGNTSRLFVLAAVDQPCVDAGGNMLIERKETYLDGLDPFSEAYELYSFILHGDSSEVKIDGEGRISLTDLIREQTGITDHVAFVGRGYFFQMWQPDRFAAYRYEARKRVAEMRGVDSTNVRSGNGAMGKV